MRSQYKRNQSPFFSKKVNGSLTFFAITGCLVLAWHAYPMFTAEKVPTNTALTVPESIAFAHKQEKLRQALIIREREEATQQEAVAKAILELAAEKKAKREAQKEAAWKQFYKPSQACREDPVTVECANAHIRAKREFEATYVETYY